MKFDAVTVGIVNYNGKATLLDTLRSVFSLDYPIAEVVVVDNRSTDGSREMVQEQCPQARLVALDRNVGLPGARNVILREARTDYVFILDNDISVEPDVLAHLMMAMKTLPRAAACHPEIKDPNDPVAYHYNGGWIHYLCAFKTRTRPDDTRARPEYEIFDVISGGALLIDRRTASKIGYFDEDYFFNWEDGDFTARLTLAGYQCVNVPAAVVHHRSKPRGTSKVFYQTRNRWFYVLKLYSWRTLLFTAPMFTLFELSQAVFLTMKGAARDYWRGSLAAVQMLPRTLEKRSAFQKLKVVRDQDWLQAGELYIPSGLAGGKAAGAGVKIFTGIVNAYWKVVRPLC